MQTCNKSCKCTLTLISQDLYAMDLGPGRHTNFVSTNRGTHVCSVSKAVHATLCVTRRIQGSIVFALIALMFRAFVLTMSARPKANMFVIYSRVKDIHVDCRQISIDTVCSIGFWHCSVAIE